MVSLAIFAARMECREHAGEISYRSVRTDGRGHGERFEASYGPTGESFRAQEGTLEHFLTERYCLYAQRNDGVILRGEIHHAPWELRCAGARVVENTMAERLAVILKEQPALLHFSEVQEVIVWRPRVVAGL